MNTFKDSAADFLSLLYPHFCPACDDVMESHEKDICTTCRVNLPRTKFLPKTNNQIEKLFWGKVEIQSAMAFLQFHKSSAVKNLLHALKYHGAENVGELLGRMFASENFDTDFFNDIDVIVPVPLHKSKKRVRGYNQCDSICRGISDLTEIKVSFNGLERNRATETQTSKTRFQRWENTHGLFQIKDQNLRNKHILLVDDVITTGATLEACANALVAEGNRVSILAMACPID